MFTRLIQRYSNDSIVELFQLKPRALWVHVSISRYSLVLNYQILIDYEVVKIVCVKSDDVMTENEDGEIKISIVDSLFFACKMHSWMKA